MKVSVIGGNILSVKADALITAINLAGDWRGGIDRAIKGVVGNLFHAQAREAMPFQDGDTIVASGRGTSAVAFDNVIFVGDNLERALSEIIYAGLEAAAEKGYKSVTLPAIRTGVMLGEVEETLEEAINELGLGISVFMVDYPNSSLESITFVIFNDTDLEKALAAKLRGN